MYKIRSGCFRLLSEIRIGRLGLSALAFAAVALLLPFTPARAATPSLPTGKPYNVRIASIAMVWIAPGEFAMGAEEDDEGGPKVTISKGFWLGKYEVTQAQWKKVTGDSVSDQLAKYSRENPPRAGLEWVLRGEGNNYPVFYVSWTEAMEFCQMLTQQERAVGRLPEDWEYTLPTETQWEYACRAGTTGDFAGKLDAMAWYDQNAGGRPHPVGQKQPNAWGLYDMHGNVGEWCRNSYDNSPNGAARAARVVRGGDWGDQPFHCRSHYRGRCEPTRRGSDLGFRLALSPVR